MDERRMYCVWLEAPRVYTHFRFRRILNVLSGLFRMCNTREFELDRLRVNVSLPAEILPPGSLALLSSTEVTKTIFGMFGGMPFCEVCVFL